MKTRNIILAGLFTAIICVISQIIIPMPFGVPITLQTFAVALCGYILSTKYALFAVIAYIILGLLGLPVFSGFEAGPGVLFGMTGGFIFGFLFLTALCGLGCNKNNRFFSIFFGIIGLLLCHLLGILQFSYVANITFSKSFILSSAFFLPKDIISVASAYFTSVFVNKRLFKNKNN